MRPGNVSKVESEFESQEAPFLWFLTTNSRLTLLIDFFVDITFADDKILGVITHKSAGGFPWPGQINQERSSFLP